MLEKEQNAPLEQNHFFYTIFHILSYNKKHALNCFLLTDIFNFGSLKIADHDIGKENKKQIEIATEAIEL